MCFFVSRRRRQEKERREEELRKKSMVHFEEEEEDGATVYMMNQNQTRKFDEEEEPATMQLGFSMVQREKKVTLTNISNTNISYSAPIHGKVLIGKNINDCSLVIQDDASVSRRHCAIEEVNDSYYIEDLNSTNGTFVNNRRINGKTQINNGDTVKIGRGTFRFTVE